MLSEQKTISIDPDLFVSTERTKAGLSNRTSSTKETLKRPKKVKPKIPKGPSSNTLRKNLLARIKEHQMREQKEFQKNKQDDNGRKSISKKEPSEFEDEFSKSLAYLSELAKTTELHRHEKKQKSKNTLTLKTSSMRNPQNLRSVPNNVSFQSNQAPEVKLEMPKELSEPMYEVKVLPPLSKITAEPVEKQYPSIANNQNVDIPVVLTKDVPYGILRGGNKPTYREYTRKLTDTSSGKPPLTIHNYNRPQVQSVREQLLNELKTKRQEGSKPNISIPATKHRKTKTIKRTTSRRKFKLGKDGKKRVISVLVKNNATRRLVKLELGRLKTVPIKDVRHYLKRHGLLKVGSVAPPDVLRKIYEQSVLSGDIHNTAKETLIHNFLNDKEPCW